MVCEDVHATREVRAWLVCLAADLASMRPSRLLADFDEAIKHSLQQVFFLSDGGQRTARG